MENNTIVLIIEAFLAGTTRTFGRRRLCAARVLALLLLALPTVVQGQYFWSTNGDGTITLTGYSGSNSALSLPAAINDRPVTAIDTWAFAYNAALTGVMIPSSVTNISGTAFNGCGALTSFLVDSLNPAYSSREGVLFSRDGDTLITYPCGKGGDYSLPSGASRIAEWAFSGCTGLTSVRIGNNVRSIEQMAFDGCTGLTSVTIPSGVTNLVANYYKLDYWWGSFARCSNLTNMAVDQLNSTYSSLDGVVFNKNKDTLILYPLGKGGAYIVPDSVTSIGGGAFGGCGSLTSVTFTSGLISIGNSAFYYCDGLTSLRIPDSVTSIGWIAFYGCSALTNVAIGNGVTNINDEAFAGCGMTSLTIGNSATTMGYRAFGDCTELRRVYFAGNAPTADDAVFFGTPNATVYFLAGAAGWGSTFAGLPAVLWNPLIQVNDASFGLRAEGFGFKIAGTPNIPLVVEASADVAIGAWIPLQTLTLTNGLASFTDPQWTNYPIRSYRIRSP